MTLQAQVLHGDRIGRTIGFPTLNFDVALIKNNPNYADLALGVYACTVKIKNKLYFGAMYYGPRVVLGEVNDVFEVHVLDFNETIYGELVSVQVKQKTRDVRSFASLDTLKKQLQQDIMDVRDFFAKADHVL